MDNNNHFSIPHNHVVALVVKHKIKLCRKEIILKLDVGLIVTFHVDLQIWSKKALIGELSATFQAINLNFKIYQKNRQLQEIIANYLQLYHITHISHIAK